MRMRKRLWEPVDRGPDPEQRLIEEEEAAAREATAARFRVRAAALKQACMRLDRWEKGLVTAFLMDDNVRRAWLPMSSAEVGALLGHTANWVRVHKHFVRKEYPCGGGPTTCGRDEPACAHERGRKQFYTALVRSLNTGEVNEVQV